MSHIDDCLKLIDAYIGTEGAHPLTIQAREELSRLRERCGAAERVAKHAEHGPLCANALTGTFACNCGLDAARAALTATQEKG